jgi:long-subunit acyl-CoA synthetase (AMP-forming)
MVLFSLFRADVEICWILEFAKAQVVLVDKEYEELVRPYKCKRIIPDWDVDGKTGDYEDVVRQGQEIDLKRGGKGWDDLVIDDIDENDTNVLNCTSGTTSTPKVTHIPIISLILVRRNDLPRDLPRRVDQHY